ncbi:hypothetical protein F4284_07095 [Salmonella enterica]|nr:hypothetical protein [Salmonella enterica]
MNLVDAFVKKVISEPYEEYGKWWIDVEYISWGVPGKTRLMFESKEQALEVKEGGNDSNLLIVFYVQIMPDDFVMQLHRF